MISISKEEIRNRILAVSAMHYRTSSERPAILTRDSREAFDELISVSWSETISMCPGLVAGWEEDGDLITAEISGNRAEKPTRALLESVLFHLVLARSYGLSRPDFAAIHFKEVSGIIEGLRESPGDNTPTRIKDGF